MNNIEKAMVRGLYKEAGVKETLSGLVDKAKKYYEDNKDVIHRAGITGGSALAGAGISAGVDKLRGKKVSLLRMLLSGLGAGAVAEGAQHVLDTERPINRFDEILNDLGIKMGNVNAVTKNTENGTFMEEPNDKIKTGEQLKAYIDGLQKSPIQKIVDSVKK